MSATTCEKKILAAMAWRCGGYGVSVSDWSICYIDATSGKSIQIHCNGGVEPLFSLLNILSQQLKLPVAFAETAGNNGIESKMWQRYCAKEPVLMTEADEELVTVWSYYTC